MIEQWDTVREKEGRWSATAWCLSILCIRPARRPYNKYNILYDFKQERITGFK
jgi:hypothetical protein